MPIQFRQPLSWVILSWAARVPIAVGRKATVTMHFPPPGAIGCERQVSLTTLKSPGVGPTMSRLRMTIGPSPPLTMVIGRCAEPPTGTKSKRTNSVVVHSSGVPVCACPVAGRAATAAIAAPVQSRSIKHDAMRGCGMVPLPCRPWGNRRPPRFIMT